MHFHSNKKKHASKKVNKYIFSLFFLIYTVYFPTCAYPLIHQKLGSLPDRITYSYLDEENNEHTDHLTQNNQGQMFLNQEQIPDNLITTLSSFIGNIPLNQQAATIIGILLASHINNIDFLSLSYYYCPQDLNSLDSTSVALIIPQNNETSSRLDFNIEAVENNQHILTIFLNKKPTAKVIFSQTVIIKDQSSQPSQLSQFADKNIFSTCIQAFSLCLIYCFCCKKQLD